MMPHKELVQSYVDGWKEGKEEKILDALTEDCIIIESHGPTYHGKGVVKKWIEDWHHHQNIVEKRKITSFHICDDLVIFEWTFAYKNRKTRECFEGVSLAKIGNNKISYLREYRATAFPFMWQPSS